ncbi:MAG: hypothetical protein MHPSP_004921, partial [Paramarteilia canceri]
SEYVLNIRKTFIVEDEKILVSVDFKQFELRILAFVSQCSKLIKDLTNEEDYFKYLTSV